MSQGMKVSKAGSNALTAGNDELSFNSALATHSIYSVSTLNISSGTAAGTVSHNLGFVPKAWVFYSDGTALSRTPVFDWNNGIYIDYYIGTANVVVEVADDTKNYSCKVVIFTRAPKV